MGRQLGAAFRGKFIMKLFPERVATGFAGGGHITMGSSLLPRELCYK